MLRRTSLLQNSKMRMQSMSIEKPQNQSQFKQVKNQNNQTKLNQVIHKGTSSKHHALIKDQVAGQDVGCLFTCLVPRSLKTRITHIIVKNTVYIISNWTGDKYPNVIYLCLTGFTQGYKTSKVTVDGQGVKTYTETGTDRIAALQLDQVQGVIDESGIRTYQLKYTIRDSVYWQLPQTMNRVYLTVKTDDSETIEQLPLPNPMTLNLQVRVQ